MKVTFLSAFILSLLSFGASASQVSGLDLAKALNSSLEEASVEVDVNSIYAFQSIVEDHEIEVSFLSEDHLHLTYGCHYHGSTMACHEEGHDHKNQSVSKSGEKTFSNILSAHESAVAKLTKTLTRRGADFGAVSALKVWTHTDDHDHGHAHKLSDDHDHGQDVWTKFNYTLAGKDQVIYVLCHTHGHDTEFSCHYSKTGEGEPQF
ncbi:putative exported protein [Halobacteriovorax marinus SJ]|uniref:Exported protein n=1 Tax=Halobacteriovorax marinus (strain ATCC BAA-682 / DSM 15412 / SJ) TaxID=862908 RepID=E1WX20_HALMS|nr:hypothetical protein [Halobacteriovorax marinus]CBW25721.1 putative exported protein [Halobacteriovorax marinus SJ]